jgi:hypothetical protein
MAAEHGIALTVTHAIRRAEPRTFDAILCRLTELVRQPRSAVLICLTGHLDHWTVLKSLTERSLVLFDSSGHTRIKRTSCRSSAKRPRGAQRAYFIEPKGMFLVRAKPH